MSDLLRCTICNAAIRGMTGLQEVQNLRRHMLKKHRANVGMNGALEVRAAMEDQAPVAVDEYGTVNIVRRTVAR